MFGIEPLRANVINQNCQPSRCREHVLGGIAFFEAVPNDLRDQLFGECLGQSPKRLRWQLLG